MGIKKYHCIVAVCLDNRVYFRTTEITTSDGFLDAASIALDFCRQLDGEIIRLERKMENGC